MGNYMCNYINVLCAAKPCSVAFWLFTKTKHDFLAWWLQNSLKAKSLMTLQREARPTRAAEPIPSAWFTQRLHCLRSPTSPRAQRTSDTPRSEVSEIPQVISARRTLHSAQRLSDLKTIEGGDVARHRYWSVCVLRCYQSVSTAPHKWTLRESCQQPEHAFLWSVGPPVPAQLWVVLTEAWTLPLWTRSRPIRGPPVWEIYSFCGATRLLAR